MHLSGARWQYLPLVRAECHRARQVPQLILHCDPAEQMPLRHAFRASVPNPASSAFRYLYARDLNSTAKTLIRLDSHATSYSMRMSPIRIR